MVTVKPKCFSMESMLEEVSIFVKNLLKVLKILSIIILMKTIKIARIELNSLQLSINEIPYLRGFFGNHFKYNDWFHNHSLRDSKLICRYPLIQYKLINGFVNIFIFCKEGFDNRFEETVNTIFNNLHFVNIRDKKIDIYDKKIHIYDSPIGVSGLQKYKLISPAFFLNNRNFNIYKSKRGQSRIDFLKRVLIGQMFTFFDQHYLQRGLVLEPITQKIHIDLGIYESGFLKYKNYSFLSFKGSFLTNLELPDYISIGKQRCLGYGTIVKNKEYSSII